jgi:hypothetical protein
VVIARRWLNNRGPTMIAGASVLAGTDAMAQSTVCPTANAGRPAGPGARTLIPLPNRALLAPPPKFNCDLACTNVQAGTRCCARPVEWKSANSSAAVRRRVRSRDRRR